ncbi:DNA primase [bacterium]|nr:DNA primase [bacterium]
MRIPEDKIEDVRNASDIVSIVSGYVGLKKRGQNYFGLCPFHSENTPSFSVHPGRQIYRCFGCGKGGNVFNFLMEVERITFIEAVRMLAAKAGIELPALEQTSEGPSESEQLVQANGLARDFFHSYLLNSKEADAVSAREYLAGRGYTEQAIKTYMLGYAPDSWDKLTNHAQASRISLEIMQQAGLLKRGGETNRVYDAFRDRVIFPIRNLAGRVIGFGGRRLKEPEGDRTIAKYINSPETAVYNKGKELFGLWEARNEIRRQDRAIMVEGYTDTLSLVSAGVNIVCASLGTSLTENQARLLKRFTANVSVLYDGDDAGITAAKRAVDVLLSVGCTPKVMLVPKGEDPDSFVIKAGGEAIWELLNSALGPVDFRIHASRMEGKTSQQIAHDLVASAAQIASPIDQELFLQDVSSKTGISVDALMQELARTRRLTPERRGEASNAEVRWPQAGTLTTLAEILVRNPEVRGSVFEKWNPDDVKDDRMRALFRRLYDDWAAERTPEPESILNHFEDAQVRDFLSKCLMTDDSTDLEKQLDIDLKVVKDCLKSLEIGKLKSKISLLKERMTADPSDAAIITQIQDLMRQLNDLKHSKGSNTEEF